MPKIVKSIDVNLSTGEAFVGYNNSATDGHLAKIDPSNAYVLANVQLAGTGILQTVLVEQTYHGILPFFYQLDNAIPSAIPINFTYTGVSPTASFSVKDFDQTGDEPLFITTFPNPTEVHLGTMEGRNVQNSRAPIQIWSNRERGLSAITLSGQPGFDYQSPIPPKSVVYLPKFSWSSQSVVYSSTIVVGYADRNIIGSVLGTHSSTYLASGTNLIKIDSASGLPMQYFDIPQDGIAKTTDSDGNIWGVCTKSGKIFKVVNGIVTEYGVFDTPQNLNWSSYHNALFIQGNSVITTFLPQNAQKQNFFGSDTHIISDFDVSTDGLVLITMNPVADGHASVRILDRDLFTILIKTSEPNVVLNGHSTVYQYVFGQFISKGKALLASELTTTIIEEPLLATSSSSSSISEVMAGTSSSSSNSSSLSIAQSQVRFSILDITSGTITSNDYELNGHLISLDYQMENDQSVGVTDTGEVIIVDSSGVMTLLGYVGDDVTSASLGKPLPSLSENGEQTAVRIYVGSRKGWSDRWDSGVIATSGTSVLYGGGDNLEPGQMYWVSIAVQRDGIWSLPQVKSFVVPKE